MEVQEQQGRREQCQARRDVQSVCFWLQNTCFSFSPGRGGSLVLAALRSAAGAKLRRPCMEICPSPRCARGSTSCTILLRSGPLPGKSRGPVELSSLYPGF